MRIRQLVAAVGIIAALAVAYIAGSHSAVNLSPVAQVTPIPTVSPIPTATLIPPITPAPR